MHRLGGRSLVSTKATRRDGVGAEPRSRKRRLVWPLVLAVVLALASWTIARAATLSPPADGDAAASVVVADAADAAQSPVAAPVPSASASAFGPQLEIILPPPPDTPSGAWGLDKSVTLGMSYTAFCKGGASATASAGSVTGLLDAVNAERARIGSPPLVWSSVLASDAESWSGTMAANQSSNYDLGTQAGRDAVGTQAWYDTVFHHSGHGGENIAFTYGSGTNPTGVHVRWMRSEGHCTNIMNPNYTQFGAGVAWSSDSGYFATERFS